MAGVVGCGDLRNWLVVHWFRQQIDGRRVRRAGDSSACRWRRVGRPRSTGRDMAMWNQRRAWRPGDRQLEVASCQFRLVSESDGKRARPTDLVP